MRSGPVRAKAESRSVSTILGHLVQDRHALGNSRFGFVPARQEAELKLGLGLRLDLEVELRSVQCFPNIEFFSDEHRQHGFDALADLRILRPSLRSTSSSARPTGSSSG